AVVPRSNWQQGSRSFPVIIRIRNEIDQSTKSRGQNSGWKARATEIDTRGLPSAARLTTDNSLHPDHQLLRQ
ncbi:MAG: hypothetical protein ACKPJD_21830, partial [Planctomycetaceae bacterium]